ncbi:MAG: DUF928 domain-containing protein [Tildeniella nuda ZEHNDER 1965/U140]|jgi:hypothetical protein|nr:DUF928 domain-containing protein [Tildeniella nuda ZEHNDER 1965/U140]
MFKKRVSKCTVTWIFVSLLTLTTFTLHEIPPVSGIDLSGRIQRFFTGSRPQGAAKGRQRGGARRDRCPNVSDPLVAIVPFNQKGDSFVEKTISERPVFWFYVPYLPAARRQAEFVIIDENENDVHTATFPLSQQPGLVSLKLPPTASPLKNGKHYQWVFSVICNPLNRAGDATVNGSLEKVPISDSLKRKLQTASLQDAFALYAEEGLWYEAMTAFAELGKTTTQDTDLQTSWKLLQQQLGLPESSIQKWVVYILPDKTSNEVAPPNP